MRRFVKVHDRGAR